MHSLFLNCPCAARRGWAGPGETPSLSRARKGSSSRQRFPGLAQALPSPGAAGSTCIFQHSVLLLQQQSCNFRQGSRRCHFQKNNRKTKPHNPQKTSAPGSAQSRQELHPDQVKEPTGAPSTILSKEQRNSSSSTFPNPPSAPWDLLPQPGAAPGVPPRPQVQQHSLSSPREQSPPKVQLLELQPHRIM